jgi:hypothetical protein
MILRQVIVAGCQRSGTALLAQVLGAHRAALLLDEDDGLYEWTDAVFAGADGKRVEALFAECCRKAREKYKDADARVDRDGRLLPGVGYLVLKAPNLTYHHAEVARWFPEARIIFAVRDVRDVVASMMRLTRVPIVANQLRRMREAPHVVADHPEELSLLAKPGVPAHVKMAVVAKVKMSLAGHFEGVGLPVLLVRYEDLVRDHRTWTARMIRHAGMPPGDRPSMRHSDVLQGLAPGDTDRTRAVDRRSLARWRSVLSEEEERDVWRVAGDSMERLGYSRDPPS